MYPTTLRSPKEVLKVIEDRVKFEHLDKTSALRHFMLFKGMEEWRKDKSVEMFKSGNSLLQCVEFAEISVGEMMELLTKRGVKSDLSIEEFKESLTNADEMFYKS